MKHFIVMSSYIKTCIVAIASDEEAFLDEWLCYHKLIGFEHFFLYDDDPKLPLQTRLNNYDFVTVVPWYGRHTALTGRNRQTKAYNNAIKVISKSFDWVAFIDIDEFFVFKRHTSVSQFLQEFSMAGQVSLNWHVFGH